MDEQHSQSPGLGSSPIAQLCFVTDDDLEAAFSDDPRTAAAITGARRGAKPNDPAAKKADSRAVLVYADARCRCAGLTRVPAKWKPVRNGEPLFVDKDMRQL